MGGLRPGAEQYPSGGEAVYADRLFFYAVLLEETPRPDGAGGYARGLGAQKAPR